MYRQRTSSVQLSRFVLDTATIAEQSSHREPYNATKNRFMIGSWDNNTWIPPPGWKTYSKQELLKIYESKSILWYGDSQARRAGMTMYAKLNSTADDPPASEIDDKKTISLWKYDKRWNERCDLPHGPSFDVLLCRPMPQLQKNVNVSTLFSYAQGNHISNLKSLAYLEPRNKHTMLKTHVDVMVISIGMHDWVYPTKCPERRKGRKVMDILKSTVAYLDSMSRETNTVVVWRTAVPRDEAKSVPFFKRLNDATMDLIDKLHHQSQRKSSTIYVNWAGAMEPRSLREQRLKGDTKAHLGLIPRVLLIDMITNALEDFWRDR